MIWIFTIVVHYGEEAVVPPHVCVCVWNISKAHANYPPTYFNLIPAFIRLFD